MYVAGEGGLVGEAPGRHYYVGPKSSRVDKTNLRNERKKQRKGKYPVLAKLYIQNCCERI